jgi:purine nucleosidase
MAARKIIIDCDPGIDDAIALLLALASPQEIDIHAITTVVGNRTVAQTELNARRILSLANRGDIPVYRGCERFLMREPLNHQSSHGDDGLGDIGLDAPDFSGRPEHAVDALIDVVNAAPGEVTICAIGPLTNIALALIKAPEIAARIHSLVFMGGAAFCPGNMTSQAEFNIWCDPHAAQIVLSAGIPMVMFGLDVTNKCRIVPALRDLLVQQKPETARKLAGMLDSYARGDTALHDACVIAHLIDATLFSGVDAHVSVDCTDGPCQGRTVADVTEWDRRGRAANCHVVTEADEAKLLSSLQRAFCQTNSNRYRLRQ